MAEQQNARSVGRWYSTEEAAEYLGCSRWTMQRMVRRGQLRNYKHPFDTRIRFFKGEDLDRIGMYRNG